MTVDVPQQVPSQGSRATRPAMDVVWILLGSVGVMCALALIVLSTIGHHAAVQAYPDAEVTGVVVVNGFDAVPRLQADERTAKGPGDADDARSVHRSRRGSGDRHWHPPTGDVTTSPRPDPRVCQWAK